MFHSRHAPSLEWCRSVLRLVYHTYWRLSFARGVGKTEWYMEQIPNPKAANAHVRNSQKSSVINPEYCGLIRDAIHSYGNVWFTV